MLVRYSESTPDHKHGTLGIGGSSRTERILLRVHGCSGSHQHNSLQRGRVEVILLLIATYIIPIISQAIAQVHSARLLTLGARVLV